MPVVNKRTGAEELVDRPAPAPTIYPENSDGPGYQEWWDTEDDGTLVDLPGDIDRLDLSCPDCGAPDGSPCNGDEPCSETLRRQEIFRAGEAAIERYGECDVEL